MTGLPHPFPIEHPATLGSTAAGVQWLFEFTNGYSASVIRGEYSYGGPQGLWELAVIGRDGRIDYSTPITDDVEGHLSESDVAALLERIARL